MTSGLTWTRKEVFLKPLLGLIQGLLTYWLVNHAYFSIAGTVCAIIILTFPLFALQIKLPTTKTLFLGLSILLALALIYGYVTYYLIARRGSYPDFLTAILTVQAVVGAFILFVFFCAVMEEGRFYFPYPTLFSESWTIIFKILLGALLVMLTWSLCIFAGLLFKILSISFVIEFVASKTYQLIMPWFFFGISMLILSHYEDILTKLRNILLAFCQFLYPIFVIITLSFLVILPFSNKHLADFWGVVILLSLLNLSLFNGIFQAGFNQSPYSSWFSFLLYMLFIILTCYSAYILQFPVHDMRNNGIKPEKILLLLFMLFIFIYHFCYSLAIFVSLKPWLTLVKPANTVIALIIALTYLTLAVQPGLILS